MEITKLRIFDPSTGEDYGPPTARPPKRPQRKKVFFMLDQDSEAMRQLLAAKLPSTTLRVFLYAINTVERGNIVYISQRDAAQACAMDQSQVSLALKKLKQIEALAAFRSEGRTLYMVNPAFGWNGRAEEYPEGFKAWAKLVEAQRKSANDPKFAHLQTA